MFDYNSILWSNFRSEIVGGGLTRFKPEQAKRAIKKEIRTFTGKSPHEIIEITLANFGAPAKVISENTGPRVTQYALQPVLGTGRQTKISTIEGLSDDLSLALCKPVRIGHEPGRLYLEVPRDKPKEVRMGALISSNAYRSVYEAGGLPLPLGMDMSGQPVVVDLTKLPHLLIAGQTGAGKSVCVNALICSLAMSFGEANLQMIMIDPKRVELIGYGGLPHLIRPVVTDMSKAGSTLSWAVTEMDKRYEILSEARKRNIKSYNRYALTNNKQKMAYLVIIIDELADLMIQYKEEVEPLIIRLAQMARAVGIHLVVATQRPTVDVLTGLIKANIPARLAFSVTSGTDSRVILDKKGAEELLGTGDSLYQAPNAQGLTRVQGTYIKDEEIDALIDQIGNRFRFDSTRGAT